MNSSPQLKARAAGFFWLMVFLAGSLALYLGDGILFSAANKVAPLCYIIVTLLLYDLDAGRNRQRVRRGDRGPLRHGLAEGSGRPVAVLRDASTPATGEALARQVG
jgi:hypothetical protein